MVEVHVARDGSEVSLAHLVEGFLRTGRRDEGDMTGAGLQQIRGIRRQDERGVPPQGAIGIRHGGEGVREGAL